MGTNFYLQTANKETANKYFSYDYTLTDTPTWGYEIHIAKTSAGWLPLFQSHENTINSVSDIKILFDTGEFIIKDEYGETYNWEEFTERVLNHNNGTLKNNPNREEKTDYDDLYCRKIKIPISHFDGVYGTNYCQNEYFTDNEGYEFTTREFS